MTMKMSTEFIERHSSREGYLAYMMSVIPTELHGMLLVPDAIYFKEWIFENVLKSANTW